MIWAKTVSVLAVFALSALPSWATPDRVTTSEDRLIAGTQSHVYVLREVFDNLGSHYDSLQDQHLIEISLDSGDATRFWPLRQMAVSNLDEQGDLILPGSVTERAGERHDLMAVLKEVGAQPLSPHAFPATTLTLDNGNLMQDGVQVATNFAIRKAGRSQLGILREAYPPIETEEEYMQKQQIDFYDLYAEGPWLCQLRPERHTLFRPADTFTLAKIFCEDEAYSGAWSFHVFIQSKL